MEFQAHPTGLGIHPGDRDLRLLPCPGMAERPGTSLISNRAHVVHPFAFACPAAARRLRGRDHPAAPPADLAWGTGRMIFPGQAILFREVLVLQVSAQSRDSPAGANDQPRLPHAPSIGGTPNAVTLARVSSGKVVYRPAATAALSRARRHSLPLTFLLIRR
jgi:hypothetical protein